MQLHWRHNSRQNNSTELHISIVLCSHKIYTDKYVTCVRRDSLLIDFNWLPSNYIEHTTAGKITTQRSLHISIILSHKNYIPINVSVVSNWPGHRLMLVDCYATTSNTQQPKKQQHDVTCQLFFAHTKNILINVSVVSDWPDHRLMLIDCYPTTLKTQQPEK